MWSYYTDRLHLHYTPGIQTDAMKREPIYGVSEPKSEKNRLFNPYMNATDDIFQGDLIERFGISRIFFTMKDIQHVPLLIRVP